MDENKQRRTLYCRHFREDAHFFSHGDSINADTERCQLFNTHSPLLIGNERRKSESCQLGRCCKANHHQKTGDREKLEAFRQKKGKPGGTSTFD